MDENINTPKALPGDSGQGNSSRKAIVILLVIILIASVLFGLLAASKVDMYKTTIERLDESRNTVTQLMASATAASALLTLIPGDVATPIAEKLADVAGDFVIVLCAIYAEKFMLTILGALAFVVLIPAGCISKLLALFRRDGNWGRIGTKLIATGIAVALLVPVSAWVSGTIRDNYGPAIDQTIQAAQDASEEVQEEAETYEGDSATEKSDNWFQNLFNSAEEKLNGVTEKFQQILNNMMEAFAVLIVTTCIIPILVLVAFLWLVKTALNVDMNLRLPMPRKRL
ncbi:MAG: hypothetical protein II113_06220 [Firmicutes bacterium]|nr:hypothetical protein [Bacillota bacterium]